MLEQHIWTLVLKFLFRCWDPNNETAPEAYSAGGLMMTC